MHQPRKLRLAASIIVCFLLQAQGADKYTDENRPYEFGFKIAGEQHRHESKDKDGIIMGEFGFVTADNVYHVTVYATDKEGRFKILSMKNIHLKSSPDASPGLPTSARQGHALALPPAQAASVQAPTAPQNPIKPIILEPPGRSCSSCSIPTTTQTPPAFNQANGNNYNIPNQFGSPGSIPQNQEAFPPYPEQQNNYPGSPSYAQGPPNNYAQPGGSSVGPYTGSGPNSPASFVPQADNYGQGNPQPNAQSPGQNVYTQGGAGGRAPKQYNGPEQQFSSQPDFAKPTLVSAQMQIVDKNTDIYALRPSEKEGLPPGLTKDDMTQLLYTFNYTVGFHGHFEEGYTNGVKKGYYYVTGRNGVRTRIDYVADDSGFHPKVSQDVLDLLSNDVPKPETEKDAKYGLKGYEFKWLFYPVDS